ncbi:hypothetical protein N7491_009081 [Penicillium cf. griseofulvum]|uniref:Uncharacterized protein n=1 Tax=Penicillium cf. griseofulvum TaxID=2972120 RepID=A0A9W9JPJ7_9EURO|nr:hypothetical protein N7472_005323 [Penicillium cf. griseofulvum]KAJ5423865.1 hypothetical protein N7491_009081 [Penicillium cf. griseofulvum]KAJ5430882.1 hypothetical protein N7445_008614 [Penicillium cf. griseofulvum]
MAVPDGGVPPALGSLAIRNGITESGPFITRSATKQPVCTPRKLILEAAPSRFKIESMPPIMNKPASSSRVHEYALVVNDLMSKLTQKVSMIAKGIAKTLCFCSVGIGARSMKTAGLTSGRSILPKPFCYPFRVVEYILKKAWHMIKAVFSPHAFVSEAI